MLDSKNPSAKKSQKWIVLALLALLYEKSYDSITVTEICQKADLNRRTFYRNFESKEDVLEQYIALLEDMYMDGYHDIENPTIYEAMIYFFEFWKHHQHFIQNLHTCGMSQYIFEHLQSITEVYGNLFVTDTIATDTSKYLHAYRVGGYWNAMLLWIKEGAKISPKKMAELLL